MDTKKLAVIPVLLAVLVSGALLAMNAGISQADRGGCPNPAASNGAQHADPRSAFGVAKQIARGCATATPNVTPSPAVVPATPTPSPTPEVTPPPTPAPTPTPTPQPTPTATPAPTPTPTGEPATSTPSPAPTPTPVIVANADLAVVSTDLTAPANAAVGVKFFVSGDATVVNHGPTAPVQGDITLTLSVPSDCTLTSSAAAVFPAQTVPLETNVFVSRTWAVTCTQAGNHSFSLASSAGISAGQPVVDPDLSNNTGSASGSTVIPGA